MPLTPTPWDNLFDVNSYTTGTQNRSRIVALANGNILVVWNDLDNGGTVNNPAGTDIIGRIFDPFGNPVTAEFRLNNVLMIDNEMNGEIAALGNGGFMVVYEDNGADNNLAYTTYNSSGIQQNTGFLLDDDVGGEVPHSPVVAFANGSIMTAYIVDNVDGSETVWVRRYDDFNDFFGSAIAKFDGGSGANDDIGGIALTKGPSSNTFVLAIANRNAGNDSILLRTIDFLGTTLVSAAISPGTELDDVQVTVLNNGNISVVWQNLTFGAVSMAVYSSSGAVVLGPTFVAGPGNNEPSIAALRDGGFVVVWDDDNSGTMISGQRFDSAGTAVGTIFTVDSSGIPSDPNVIGLDDGRFQVSWTDNGNIFSQAFDARDVPNSAGAYSPYFIMGTVGDDVFIAGSSSSSFEEVHGWIGNDIITEAAGNTSKIYGDTGHDTIIVTSGIGVFGIDLFDGDGAGTSGFGWTDTIDWSGVNEVGATYDMINGTATSAGSQVEQMRNFENFLGTQFADTVYGTAEFNVIHGNGGNDTLSGRGGADLLNGGDGDDVFLYELDTESGDTIIGGAGYDTLFAFQSSVAFSSVSGIEAVQLSGPGFGSLMTFTGTQFTTGLAINTAVSGIGTISVNMDPGQAFISRLFSFATMQVRMVVIGTSGNDMIVAGNATHSISGGDGLDVIKGGNAVDTINGGIDIDKIIGGGGADFLTGGLGNDVFKYKTASDSGLGAAADIISDFTIGQDRMNFARIDANAGLAGDQAFAFIGTNPFGNTGNGQIRFVDLGADTRVEVDEDGNGTADMHVILEGLGGATLTVADFVL
jgi:RTX calcium-binding nonapeptide repeat (4 copies)